MKRLFGFLGGSIVSTENPNKQEAITHKSPLELVESIKENSVEVSTLLDEIEMIITARK